MLKLLDGLNQNQRYFQKIIAIICRYFSEILGYFKQNGAGVSEPIKQAEINIDQANKKKEIADITEEITSEKDKFEMAVSLRETIDNDSELQSEAQTPEHSTSSGETMIAQPAEPVVVAPELEPEAKTPAPLDPQVLEHCEQKLSRCIELSARGILENILTEFPDITSEQLIEKLAAEIPKTQRAQEFRNHIEIHSQPHSTSSVTRDSQLASAQSSPVQPTVVVQPITQQANSTSPVTEDRTQLQRAAAYLIHVQTDQQIKLPQNLSTICIGRPNNIRTPDVDVSKFPNSEFVSRLHALIHVEADRFYIEDMGSSNETYINNWRLLPGERYRIESGTYISLGKEDSVKFLFKIF